MNSKLTGEGGEEVPKNAIAIFGYKQWVLSIDMKTKIVQHVESEWVSEWESEIVWE